MDERARERWQAAGEWLEGLRDADRTGDPLALVAFWKHWADDTNEHLVAAVTAARATGCTWEQVAGALGVTKQSAWAMFRPVERAGGPGQEPVTPA